MTAAPETPRIPEVAAETALPVRAPAWWRKRPRVMGVDTGLNTMLAYAAVLIRSCQARRVSVGVR